MSTEFYVDNYKYCCMQRCSGMNIFLSGDELDVERTMTGIDILFKSYRCQRKIITGQIIIHGTKRKIRKDYERTDYDSEVLIKMLKDMFDKEIGFRSIIKRNKLEELKSD